MTNRSSVPQTTKSSIEAYFDPAQDPSLAIPDYEERCGPKIEQSPPPSREEIEAALMSDIRGEHSAAHMIERIFTPFLRGPSSSGLNPGRGLKRPTFEINLPEIGVFIPRQGVADVASRLHQYACTLAEYEIGPRAPQGAAVFEVEMREAGQSSSHTIHIPARSVKEITDAMLFALSMSPVSISAPLDMTGADLLGHVHAARKRMVLDHREGSHLRRMATDLIAAIHDLKIAVTAALRTVPDRRRYARYHGEISLHDPIHSSFREDGDEEMSNHLKRRDQVRFSAVHDAIERVFDTSEIFAKLPENISLRIDGEAQFLRFELFDRLTSGSSFSTSISESLMEFERLDELAEKLGEMISPANLPEACWTIHLSGEIRSNCSYRLCGPTLSQALIDHARQRSSSRNSLLIVDLETDLICDASGEPAKVHVWRVLQ